MFWPTPQWDTHHKFIIPNTIHSVTVQTTTIQLYSPKKENWSREILITVSFFFPLCFPYGHVYTNMSFEAEITKERSCQNTDWSGSLLHCGLSHVHIKRRSIKPTESRRLHIRQRQTGPLETKVNRGIWPTSCTNSSLHCGMAHVHIKRRSIKPT